ncbi:MAG: helix-turn-helix transcriptional regulator [Acidimicrobiia bacterium]|nr:helix-turn-helix transcriptional regulator [Acidimicrobiia bacterium]
MNGSLITDVREGAGLTQSELARRARTSRPTLSAYERGRVFTDPRHGGAHRPRRRGYQLVALPKVRWHRVPSGRGRIAWVPDRLPRLEVDDAFRRLELPLHLEWSGGDRAVELSDRRARARVYETALREGRPRDIEALVDGTLLVDLWEDIVLPRQLRAAWQPLIDEARGADVGTD